MPGQAETERAYDVLPYPAIACRESHPGNIEAIARLFGFGAARGTECRVLEIGCGTGVNLLAMAETLPASSFVGLDLSGVQIGIARELAHAAGLKNVQLEKLDLCEAPASLGDFDYILCNGVYSWVPAEVQSSLLAAIRRHLAPAGLAFVSYNTLPGWFSRGVIRSMMLFHAGGFDDPRAMVRQARNLLGFLAQTAPAGEAHYRAALQREAKLIGECPDEYVFHELLSADNSPVWFHQFVEAIERHDLLYFGDANLSSMWSGNRTDQVQRVLQQLSEDFLTREQYLDFVLNRTFRRSLICRSDKSFARSIHASAIRDGFLFTSLDPDLPVDLTDGAPVEVQVSPESARLKISDRFAKAGLSVLCRQGLAGLPFQTFVRACAGALGESGAGDSRFECEMAAATVQLVLAGLAELEFRPAPFVTAVSPQPQVSRLARVLALRQNHLVNRRHQSVTLDLFTRHVASLLDGETGVDAVCFAIQRRIAAGELPVPDDIAALPLEQAVGESLQRLAAELFLVG